MCANAEGFLAKDKFIGPLIQKYGSCTIKPIKKSMYFEDLVDAICSQQLSGKAAKTIFDRVSYIKDLSLKIINSELQITHLDKLGDEEVVQELIKVKGIGRWTAEMFLMFGLGRLDILPKDDLGINKALKNLKISPKDTEKWRPYRTVASWYLWRSLENRD